VFQTTYINYKYRLASVQASCPPEFSLGRHEPDDAAKSSFNFNKNNPFKLEMAGFRCRVIVSRLEQVIMLRAMPIIVSELEQRQIQVPGHGSYLIDL